jgi:2-keto-4-pentenoate hydratase/2-oxohepta-3-ene-1,7-dioic acid hydratase in catechol pathway
MNFEIEGLPSIKIGTIYGIGRNYSDHAKEMGHHTPDKDPIVFLKSVSSARGLLPTTIPFDGDELHFEAELVIHIGQKVHLSTNPVGWDVVGALGLGLDLTHRQKQTELKSKGLPWTLAKSFDGSSILTPMIPKSEFLDQKNFKFEFFLEGKLRQQGDTTDMLFSVPEILTFLASSNTLYPGDLVFTGTPAGVGPIRKGQSFCLKLINPERTWQGIL